MGKVAVFSEVFILNGMRDASRMEIGPHDCPAPGQRHSDFSCGPTPPRLCSGAKLLTREAAIPQPQLIKAFFSRPLRNSRKALTVGASFRKRVKLTCDFLFRESRSDRISRFPDSQRVTSNGMNPSSGLFSPLHLLFFPLLECSQQIVRFSQAVACRVHIACPSEPNL